MSGLRGMVVDWREKAQQHWIEQLEFFARTFGEPTASGFIKSTDTKIDRICKFPTSGTIELLLVEFVLYCQPDRWMEYRLHPIVCHLERHRPRNGSVHPFFKKSKDLNRDNS